MSEYLVQFNNISKFFGKVIALKDVTMKLKKGEIMCLLGDNGAGKSTLIKVLSGVHKPTSGVIKVDGNEVKFGSPREATSVGIGTVYQDLALNALTSVTRNFFLGNELKKGPGPLGILDFKNMNEITIAEMGKIGINISDPTQLVGTMSGGQRQTLAIARAIYFGAKILILDEPTSALGQKQQMEVLKTIKKVQQLGNIAIILITHNEIHARLIADRFTFLSLGEVIGSGKSSELGGDDVKRLMAGGAQIGDLAKELEAV